MPSLQQALQHLALAWVDVALRRAQPELRLVRGIPYHGLAGHARTGIQSSQPVAVKAYGGWADYEQATKTSSNGKCGPVSAAFLPHAGRAYLAEMDWSGGQCQLKISDASDPDSPIPVETLPVKSCPASD